MNTTRSTSTRFTRSGLLGAVGAALVLVVALLAPATQARAADFTMEVTDARLNLGWAFNNTAILPAPNNIGGSPLPDLWDARDTLPATCLAQFLPGPTPNPNYPCDPNPASATISGSKDDSGNISIAASDFRFPIMVVTSPIDGSPVPITLAATGEVTGTMDNGNGEMDLTGPMEARVLLLTAPATEEYPIPPLQSYCAVPLPGLSLTTGVSTPASAGFVGVPFAGDDPQGAGALTGTWKVTGESIRNGNTVYGDPAADRCSSVDIATQGFGGIWLGAGVSEPPPYPQCEAPQTGTWPDCADPTPFTVSSVRVSPSSKTVKAGQKVKLTVRVSNSGETAGSTTVRVKLSNSKGFSLSTKSVNVSVGAESSASKTVVVSTTRKAKGKKSVVTASAGGKSGKATVKVRR